MTPELTKMIEDKSHELFELIHGHKWSEYGIKNIGAFRIIAKHCIEQEIRSKIEVLSIISTIPGPRLYSIDVIRELESQLSQLKESVK